MIPGLLVGQLGLLLLAAAAASTVLVEAAEVEAAVSPVTPPVTATRTSKNSQQQQPKVRLPATFNELPAKDDLMLSAPTATVGQDLEEAAGRSKLQVKNEEVTSSGECDQLRQPVYTNQFVIQVKGGEQEARKLAEKHGFLFLNHILGDYYHLEHKRLSKRSTSLIGEHEEALSSIQDEPQVLKIERQLLKRRVKRDFLELPGTANQPNQQAYYPTASTSRAQTHRPNQPRPPLNRLGSSASQQYTLPANQPARGRPRPLAQLPPLQHDQHLQHHQHHHHHHHHHHYPATSDSLEVAASGQQQTVRPMASNTSTLPFVLLGSHSMKLADLSGGLGHTPTHASSALHSGFGMGNSSRQQQQRSARPFNDPSWPLMWYLDGGAKNGFDLNVMAAWKMGYTGKGIVITILDDGLERNHPDLQANYDPLASFDINGDDADPMPRYDDLETNRHGTRCAGEVAAVPDNNICSIGIAYNSKVGGVRMLDGDVTDAVEARSLGLNNQHIHIYSASWGPDDNGRTVDGPGELATRAFIEGVTNGRQGLGSIFVFASGNGGREHDNCNCDGYTNSIWTLSISSATENGFVPWYIEACSSTLATTYSSGSYDERQISTTDIRGTCTSGHTGTSASAPLAAGICALVLESNPRLSWRDMQHIVVRTAKPANLVAKDWRQNALGRNVSHAFGYGLMDAASMISMAKRWTSVPVQYTCEVRSPQMEKFIPAKGYIELKLRAECANVKFLEHVQSKVTLSSNRRGDLHIYLISPHGTRSTLLAQRPNDQAEQGFRNWPFMTVHSWGESPNGVWTLEVHNDGKPQNRAYLKEWTLILYGTSEDPNKHLDIQLPSSSQRDFAHSPHLPRPTPNTRVPHVPHGSGDEHKRPSHLWTSHASSTRPPSSSSSGSSSADFKQILVSQQHPPDRTSSATPAFTATPDFEIIPASTPTASPMPATFNSTGSTLSGLVTPTLQTTPAPTTVSSSGSSDGNLHQQQPSKQPVLLLEHNKIDGNQASSTLPPATTADILLINTQASGASSPASSFNSTGKPTVAGGDDLQHQFVIGNNQIDSKLLTKDYRSSGDQSTLNSGNNFRPEVASSSSSSGGSQLTAIAASSNLQGKNHSAQQPTTSNAATSSSISPSHYLMSLLLMMMLTQLLVSNFQATPFVTRE